MLGGGTLYGTTYSGGNSHGGTVFKTNTDGTGYTILKEFSGSDVESPCVRSGVFGCAVRVLAMTRYLLRGFGRRFKSFTRFLFDRLMRGQGVRLCAPVSGSSPGAANLVERFHAHPAINKWTGSQRTFMRAMLKPKIVPTRPSNKFLLPALLTVGTLAMFRAPSCAEEIFPRLTINGDIHTNVSVIRTTPVEVTLRWESGGGGVYKRQKLPPELAARYPYDPKAAEEWAAETARQERRLAEQRGRNEELARAASAQVRAQQRERLLQGLNRKEAELRTQITWADKQLSNMDETIRVLDGRVRGTRRNSPAHLAADRARDQKLVALDQIHNLHAQLDAVHEQINECR